MLWRLPAEEDQQKLTIFYQQKLTRQFDQDQRSYSDIRTVMTSLHWSKRKLDNYTEKAFETLSAMEMDATGKENLKQFGLWLMNRSV